jgi:hypothetical protein
MKPRSRSLYPIALTILTALVGLLPAWADTDVFTANTFAGGWEGTITWTDGTTEPFSARLSGDTQGGGPPLLVRFTLGFDDCIGDALEKVRVNQGRVIMFEPVAPTRCKKPVTSLQVVATKTNEIGVVVVGGMELAGQGVLTPLDPALTLTLPKPKGYAGIPQTAPNRASSLAGYFAVTPEGAVYELIARDYSLRYKIIAPSTFQADAGLAPGQIFAKGSYKKRYSTLSLAEKVYFLPENKAKYAHCPPMYMRPTLFDLVDVKNSQQQPETSTVFAMKPRDARYCTQIGTNNKSCRVIRCTGYADYGPKQTLVLKDGALARKLGEAARATYQGTESYADALARLREQEARRPKGAGGGPSKGYFDRGGACGTLSCEEEDTLQFLVDQYW